MAILNIATTPAAELCRAFDAMEGEGFFDLSVGAASESVASARRVLETCRESRSRAPGFYDEDDNDAIPETIYGQGGGNRYIVLLDGSILLSKMHCGAMLFENETTRRAQALGFGLW